MRDKAGPRNVELVTKLQLQGVRTSTSTRSKNERVYTNPIVEMFIALTDIFKCDFNAFFSKYRKKNSFIRRMDAQINFTLQLSKECPAFTSC